MKFCTTCGSEYQDSVERCANCDFSELVSEQEMRARKLTVKGQANGQIDTRRFARAGTVEDPLSAEELSDALRARGIAVFTRQRMGGTVDPITDGVTPYWEILVAESDVPRAAELIQRERMNLRATEEEAVRAAEEEAGEELLQVQQVEAKPL